MKVQTQAVRKDSVPADKAVLPAQAAKLAPSVAPSLGEYLGIFLTSSSVLLFELALTRIFAVVLWAHLAFMVVGTALFGFGLSGVYLALRRSERKLSLPFLCLCSSLLMVAAYLIVRSVPFRIWELHNDPFNYLYLALWYVGLVVPFFFAGLTIAELLRSYPLHSSRLYGVDLIGAACGSLALIPLLPVFQGEGIIFAGAALSALSGLCFLSRRQSSLGVVLLALVLALGTVLPNADSWFPVKLHQTKRLFNRAVENKLILATRWSPLSRVDIAEHNENYRAVWIDGGTNESIMIRVDGKVDDIPARWKSSIAIAYMLKQKTSPNVLIIGPSGGREVIYALSWGASHVDAVELDPSIVKFVNEPRFASYMGNLYQNPRVNLVNDEGRAFLRRQPDDTYDVIQFVNNYTPVAIAAGALNLSETFLLTKEAFIDYFRHLAPNGILALHRGATLRVALTALEALREIGIPHPEKHLLITGGERQFFEGFFLKKSVWEKDEVRKVRKFLRGIVIVGGKGFLWNPLLEAEDTMYSRLIRMPAEERAKYYTSLGVNLYPATDDRPFMDRFLQIGRVSIHPDMPVEFKTFSLKKWRNIIPRGDFPYVMILVESAVLGLFFVGLPLLLWARSAFKTAGFLGIVSYYAALGLGFIIVEICLMKRYVLFIGNPVYSLTTILVVLLLGAGVGSMSCDRLFASDTRRAIALAVSFVVLAVLAETALSPVVFQSCLGLGFSGRVFVASSLLFPLGFFMGMPFPLGLRLINEAQRDEAERKKLVAWAWGINGYTTVIGSAATVFIALYFGFRIALLTAVAVYILGMLCLLSSTRDARS